MLTRPALHPYFYRWGVLAACAMLLLVHIANVPRLTAATNYTIEWGTAQNITNTNIKTVFPSVAVDGSDVTHIVYSTDDGSGQHLYYTNNATGTFAAPQTLRPNVGTDRNPFFTLVAGPNNTLHLVYAWLLGDGDKQIYYMKATVSGTTTAWSSPQIISESGKKSVAPSLAVAADGTVHIMWADQRCDGARYNIFYRGIAPGGALSGVSQVAPNCAVGQGKPRLVVTNDGKAHAVFSNNGELTYVRREGTTWVATNLSNSPGINSDNPAIATDGTALYVPWDEGVNGHDIVFRRSVDGGLTWSNTIGFSTDASFASFPSAAYSSSSQRLYVAWQDTIGTGAGHDEIWYREFDPSDGTTTEAKRLSIQVGSSAVPSIAVGPSKAALAWHDKVTGEWQIYAMGGTIAGAGCSGKLELASGVPVTSQNPVPGQITPAEGCTPAEMQIGVGKVPDANATKLPYQSAIEVPVPADSCAARSVYVKLYDSEGRSGAPIAAQIKVDTVVSATVMAVNPHMQSLQSFYTPLTAQDQASGGTPPRINDAQSAKGASDGHPNYTRDRAFFLAIRSNGDCAGLRTYDVEGSIAGDVPSTGMANVIALPGNSGIGNRDFHVVISDTISNEDMFPSDGIYKIIYDPASTSTTITNTDGLPVLANGGTVTDDTETNSIIRKLTFSGINVTDNLYGQAESLAAGKQFWGVWVANSRQDAEPGTLPPNLNWFPVPVSVPDASFSVSWNLFNGLDYGADPTKSGDYYIYVRFLDGAGNPSVGYIKTKVTLASGYTLPSVRLPFLRR